MACAPIIADAVLSSAVAQVDCYALTIGADGYRALAGSSVLAAFVIPAVLTIFVAVFGYRMMLGETPSLREIVMATVKIGLALALAANWGAFRTLAYNTAMRGPSEIVAVIGRPTGASGLDGGLVPQLQAMDDAMARLVRLGAGKPDDADAMAGPTAPLNAAQQQAEMQRLGASNQRPRWDPQKQAETLDLGRTLFLAASIATLASVRLVAGIMLALTPFFALLALFRGTRGLFAGWLRVIGGAALGAVTISLILGVEAALVGPWLTNVLALREAGVAVPGFPSELRAVTLAFGLILLAALAASARVAMGFRIPDRWRDAAAPVIERLTKTPVEAQRQPGQTFVGPAAQHDRAMALADAIAGRQRKEAAEPAQQVAWLRRQEPAAATARGGDEPSLPKAARLGQSFRRAGQGRIGGAAARRDRKV